MINDRAPAVPAVDPAVALENVYVRGPGSYPPGFYGGIRRRIPVFAFVGAMSVLAGLIPFPRAREQEVLIAGAIFFSLTALAMVLPWRRIPQWFWPIIPIGYISVIALIRDARGANAGLVSLYFLPIIWLTFYGRRWQLIMGIGAVLAALIVPILVVGGKTYNSDWREVIVTMVVATVVSFAFLTMVGRDRAYVADMAEQSRYARASARIAMEAREQLDSLLRAATETAIVGLDSQGVVTFFSAGAERLFGYESEEVVGRLTIGEFFYNQELADRGQELDAVVRAITAGAARPSAESVWTYVRKDGTRRRGAISVTPRTTVGHAVGYVVVAIDVTEREQLAVERERLLAVQREVTEVLVEQNNRLRELTQMKDDVVATVSHELRTPLTSIRGFIELLLDDPHNSLDSEQLRMLTTIERNSLHLLNVADDLLADPGGGHGLRVHFVDADLAIIAVEAVDTMAAQAASQRVALNLDTEGPVIVHGDPARLHQLLGNLISNAVKFSSRGGRVLVSVDTWDQFARLQVLDDGPGIPDEERPQLFERFYRLASATDQGIPGTGLGLAIAKSVVEAHEGTVDIIDTPGWSTTFRVLLPLADSKVHHVPAVSA